MWPYKYKPQLQHAENAMLTRPLQRRIQSIMGPTRIRDIGYAPGYYRPGEKNSILDVPGLQVGLKTVHDEAEGVHTGVTLIYPRGVELSRKRPSYAAMHCLNGGGEMTSVHFIRDWGFTSSVRV